MHCELYIPDFFHREGPERADGLESAKTLIARGRRRRGALVSREAWLFGRFGVPRQRDWPVAPYTLLADGGVPGPHYWMRADPVRFGRFGVPRQRDWPVAPYTLLADGGVPGPHYWMRADPV